MNREATPDRFGDKKAKLYEIKMNIILRYFRVLLLSI